MTNKRGRTYEATDMQKMIERTLRGLVKRAGNGEVEAIQALQSLMGTVDASLSQALLAAHEGEFRQSLSYLQAETGLDRKTVTRRLAKAKGEA